jgi:peptidyl-Asp metalloendopeptidase
MNNRSVSPSYRLLVAVGCVLAVLGGARVDAQALAPLLATAPPSAAAARADAAGRREVVRSRRVTVDVTRLAEGTAADADLRARGTLLLNLFDDATFVATLDRTERTAGGYNWVGGLAGLEGSQVVLSVVGDVVTATIFAPGSVYGIRYAGDGIHEAVQIDQSQFPPEQDAAAAAAPPGQARADAVVTAADAGSVVDLLVVYTPAARLAADAGGGSAAINSVIANAVSLANTSYANSGVTQRLRLVRAEEVAYTETSISSDLYALQAGTGALSGVAGLRNTYGADVVSFIGNWPGTCGLGFVMSTVGSWFASSAFTAVVESCAAANLSLAHELGHNMGANHDWYVDSSVLPQTYAHGYANTGLRWRTIMAYNDVCAAAGANCTRLPYWSNPGILYSGAAMGIPGGTRSNCTTGNISDTACDADDHRTLNETAATVAAFRSAVSPVATPVNLRFGATKNGAAGALVALTPAQQVTVTTSSSSVAWTASADQPWVRLTDITGTAAASGTGTGRFVVSIVNPGNVLGASTNVTSTITVTPSASGQVAASVLVTLSVSLVPSGTALPLGQVDTPAQGATGIVGTIGVTGWALDDVGVNKVRIYRNCLSFEDTPTGSPCVTLAGSRMVYIGDAAFLAGARPDVEAAFPGYPQGYRAGWGYLMLTNMLPHVPRGLGYGGQGTITLYAIATDEEGQATLLGRSRLDHVATTFTLDNDAIAKPFGAMDTPGQGETVSGIKPNFGWVLTPDRAGTGIVMPTDGSTMHVYIDGVSVAQVTYNQCRGTVGNPVPSGVYCDDDVANIFGTASPQATGTPRPTNPSIYRNLDIGRGAIGSYDIDTRAMTNGMHTIAWGVVDSNGRTEGIGSRFFTVINAASGDTATPASAEASTRAMADAPARPRADARVLDGLGASSAQVMLRTGFALQALSEPLPAGSDGVRRVQLAALGRLELQLGAVDAGYLEANGTLRDLPPGSHLDTSSGVFTWAPGVGYHGTYRLVFLSPGAKTTVAVTVRPEVRAKAGESEIRMFLDLPAASSTVGSAWSVAGWALDPQAAASSGIGAVHVWAQRRDATAAPQYLGSAALDVPRSDVAEVFGEQFGASGFQLAVRDLPPGRYDVMVYAWNRRTARWEDARAASIRIR